MTVRYLRWGGGWRRRKKSVAESKRKTGKTSGVSYSKKRVGWEPKKKKTSITTERFHISWMVRCILWENIIYGFQPWMVMKGRKTALNVKIEKLLSVFSWQNIFIAFSSATIFLFLFNEIWCLNVCSIFLRFCSLYLSLTLPYVQPLIRSFHFFASSFCFVNGYCRHVMSQGCRRMNERAQRKVYFLVLENV